MNTRQRGLGLERGEAHVVVGAAAKLLVSRRRDDHYTAPNNEPSARSAERVTEWSFR